MTDEKKREFVEEYNAAETLYNNKLINSQEYDNINQTILRTIIGHFAIELNKEDKE